MGGSTSHDFLTQTTSSQCLMAIFLFIFLGQDHCLMAILWPFSNHLQTIFFLIFGHIKSVFVGHFFYFFLKIRIPYILSFLQLYYGRFMAILRPFSDHLKFGHFLALSWPFSDLHLAIFYLFYVVQDHLIVRSSFRLLIVHPTAETIVVH